MSNPDQHWSDWAPYPKDAGWRLRLPVSTERSVNCPRRQTSTFARPAGIGTSVMRTTSLSRARPGTNDQPGSRTDASLAIRSWATAELPLSTASWWSMASSCSCVARTAIGQATR